MSSGSSSSHKRSRTASTSSSSKKARRSYKAKSKTTTINPRFGVVAPRLKATLKYFEQGQIAVTAGAHNTYLFNLNSLFDPNRTGTGHQPMGYDNITPLYNKYIVKKCSWTVYMWVNNVAGFAGNPTYTVVPINQAGAVSGPSDTCEQPLAVFKQCLSGDSVSHPVMFSGSANLWDLFSKGYKEYMADDIYSAQNASNPGEIMTLQIGANQVRGDSITIYYTVLLRYESEFFDPIPIGGS